jgi:hypothetical protein
MARVMEQPALSAGTAHPQARDRAGTVLPAFRISVTLRRMLGSA